MQEPDDRPLGHFLKELHFFNPLMWLALTMFIVYRTGKPGSGERGRQEGKRREEERETSSAHPFSHTDFATLSFRSLVHLGSGSLLSHCT